MQHLSVIKKNLLEKLLAAKHLSKVSAFVLPPFWKAGKIFFLFIIIGLFSCSEETAKTIDDKKIQHDTIQAEFVFTEKKETVIQNGEQIKYHKNGVIEMRGMMKEGKRDGLWKSFYENGSPWSETTFKDGKKNGKTTTWYDNEKKRYEGFYTNDAESGKWIFWDENGKIQNTKNY